MPSGGALLTRESVGAYLAQQGLLQSGRPVEVVELSGGVSNIVFAARSGDVRVVVKQALSRLRVPEEWVAKRERALTEAWALELMAHASPGSVPGVLNVDPEACVVVMDLAPDGWVTWKSQLLQGRDEPKVAEHLGGVLADWHRETAGESALAKRMGDLEAFEQLRIDPYYRTVARRHPDIAGAVGAYLRLMERRKLCLVHGDYSPKNVLLAPDFAIGDVGACG